MHVTQVVDIDATSVSALPGRGLLPKLASPAVIPNEEMQESLAATLQDLDDMVSASSNGLRSMTVAEIEVSLAVSAEGRFSLVVGGSLEAAASVRVVLRPRDARA